MPQGRQDRVCRVAAMDPRLDLDHPGFCTLMGREEKQEQAPINVHTHPLWESDSWDSGEMHMCPFGSCLGYGCMHLLTQQLL